MNYKVISSSSHGNATILDNLIMIDCGVPFKALKEYYKSLKIVLLTHCHSDHFNKATIHKLAKERPSLRFATGKWLVELLVDCGVRKENIDVCEIDKFYNYGIFKIKPVLAYHDVPNCGWKIIIAGKKIFYITDTGRIDHIEAYDYDYYFIEANYGESEIEERIAEKVDEGVYPYENRVKETHLSEEQCLNFIIENATDKSQFIYMHESDKKRMIGSDAVE